MAVRKWRFEPGEIDGDPVSCEVKIPIKFALDEDSKSK
jgi:outer membrane biosynthesis protein TonB